MKRDKKRDRREKEITTKLPIKSVNIDDEGDKKADIEGEYVDLLLKLMHECNRANAQCQEALIQAADALRQREIIENATFWKATKPLRTTLDYLRSLKNPRTSVSPENISNVKPTIKLRNMNPGAPTHAESRTAQPGSIAIHLHAYYVDLYLESIHFLNNMPFYYDLYVSVPGEIEKRLFRTAAKDLRRCKRLRVEAAMNVGRDMAPLFVTFAQDIKKYDFMAHFHTKKSLYTGSQQDSWRSYLLNSLFGSKERIRQIFGFLTGSDPCGLVFSQAFHGISSWGCTWCANYQQGREIMQKLGHDHCPSGVFAFPVGSFFWANVKSLTPLFDLGLTSADFPSEKGQTDGTLAHTLERVVGLLPALNGDRIAVIREESNPRETMFGFDHDLAEETALEHHYRENPKMKMVLFDIFDTLLTRPFLDPEDIKEMIALNIDGDDLREKYIRYRRQAEIDCRKTQKKDISLRDIYEELKRKAGFSDAEARDIMDLEIRLERGSLRRREGVIALMAHAKNHKHRIGLVSDMFLPKKVIEGILRENEINDWDVLYLSSDVGKRKDTGQMYQHIQKAEKAHFGELVMIGDNPRSDQQIPSDMGVRVFWTPSPKEVARNFPVMKDLIEKAEASSDIGHRTFAGYLIETFFSAFPPRKIGSGAFFECNLHNVGKAFVGPLLFAYSQWLFEKCEEDKIDKLVFLARDGKIMQKVYRQCQERLQRGPASVYALLSRRAASVPAIEDMADIWAIAEKKYFRNSITMFMRERFGIDVTPADIGHLQKNGLIAYSGTEDIEVSDTMDEEERSNLERILMYFYDRIIAQGKEERVSLQRYLDELGVTNEDRVAVVDIGYSGTIQMYLDKILNMQTTGYYLITSEKIKKLEETGSRTRAYLGEYLENRSPLMFYSFLLEKLFAAQEGQVIRHRYVNDRLTTEHHTQTEEEIASIRHIEELHVAVFAGVEDLLSIKENFLPTFDVPADVLRELYLSIVAINNQGGANIENLLRLDDYYAGRGVV